MYPRETRINSLCEQRAGSGAALCPERLTGWRFANCSRDTVGLNLFGQRTVGCPRQHRQSGFSLPIAVFLLVIIALLVLGIVQLSSRSNMAATQEELSNRAFFAAESGASWSMSRLFFNAAGIADKSFSDGRCDALGGPPVLASAGLAGCTLTVACTRSAAPSGDIGYYTINSVGRCGSGQTEAVRRIEVGAKNGP